MVTAAMKLKDACSLEKSYDKPRQWIKGAFNFMAAVLVRSNLSTKVHRVKVVEALVFSGIMYACESWTVKKAEH